MTVMTRTGCETSPVGDKNALESYPHRTHERVTLLLGVVPGQRCQLRGPVTGNVAYSRRYADDHEIP
jgi:hypothetical protein